MTQKLIKVSECDSCGREVRHPETTHTVIFSVVQQGDEVTKDIRNGALLDICDACITSEGAAFLRMEGIRNYLPGTLEFTPTDNTVAGPAFSDHFEWPEDEEDEKIEIPTSMIDCPFCEFSANSPHAVGVHMSRKHKGTKGYQQARRHLFPSVAAKAQKERLQNRR